MNQLALIAVGKKIADHWLVQDVSLSLAEGQLTALLGPNGAGKTTLLRLLAGLWQPTEGKVLLNGRKLSDYSQLARYMTYVPQKTIMNFAFTVKEVVMMGRYPHLGRFQTESLSDYQAVERAMLKMDIAHLAERLVTQLSGGEQQRVVIARSLATKADIILLDEPIASLDIAHALDILELLQILAQEGKTIIFSMHDINMAIRYAHQVILISQGHIFAQGLAESVLTEAAIEAVFKVKAEKITEYQKTWFFFQHKNEKKKP
jgi:iron complex transport system ATP-binding protein